MLPLQIAKKLHKVAQVLEPYSTVKWDANQPQLKEASQSSGGKLMEKDCCKA